MIDENRILQTQEATMLIYLLQQTRLHTIFFFYDDIDPQPDPPGTDGPR